MKLKNYISGQWIEGNGHEIPLYNAVNGELVAISDTSGLDFEEALHFGRTTGYKNLSSMTFYDRGEMLKKIALYLLERKKKYYELGRLLKMEHQHKFHPKRMNSSVLF